MNIPVSSLISSMYSIPTSKTSVSPVTTGITAGGGILVSVLTVTTGVILASVLTVPNLPATIKLNKYIPCVYMYMIS